MVVDPKTGIKFKLAAVMFTLALTVVVFQNCSQVVHEENDSRLTLKSGSATVTDQDAEAIISVIAASGAQGVAVSTDQSVTYDVNSVACGSYYDSRGVVDCAVVQKIKNSETTKEYKTRAGMTERVRDYLAGIGAGPACAPADCPTVAESYIVNSVHCKRVPKFSMQSACTVYR